MNTYCQNRYINASCISFCNLCYEFTQRNETVTIQMPVKFVFLKKVAAGISDCYNCSNSGRNGVSGNVEYGGVILVALLYLPKTASNLGAYL